VLLSAFVTVLFASPLAQRDRDTGLSRLRHTRLRLHFQESPIGVLDGFQWFLFLASHSERHLKQIEEVKSDPHYPKR